MCRSAAPSQRKDAKGGQKREKRPSRPDRKPSPRSPGATSGQSDRQAPIQGLRSHEAKTLALTGPTTKASVFPLAGIYPGHWHETRPKPLKNAIGPDPRSGPNLYQQPLSAFNARLYARLGCADLAARAMIGEQFQKSCIRNTPVQNRHRAHPFFDGL